MALLNRLAQTLERSFTNRARSDTRAYLLRQSDHLLADRGFSRELLERGNRAWPWRVEDEPTTALARFVPAAAPAAKGASAAASAPSRADEKLAIAELRQLSDAELTDLDLARDSIADAVRHGRPGLDRKVA